MFKYLSVCLVFWGLTLLGGCADMGGSFAANPLTGGVYATNSVLLGISLPSGLEQYPSHGYITQGVSGSAEGLETFRGHIDSYAAARSMSGALNAQGWQLRLYLRKGQRAVYLYQKEREYAILTFHLQGVMTIIEIWKGAELAPGFVLSGPDENQPGVMSPDALPAEEFGPWSEQKNAGAATVEEWGAGIEEKEL